MLVRMEVMNLTCLVENEQKDLWECIVTVCLEITVNVDCSVTLSEYNRELNHPKNRDM